MSRYSCIYCSGCKEIGKTYCDNCNASCCQDNMKNHREIFYLSDQFPSKVNSAEEELKSKTLQVKKNLSVAFSISTGYCGHSLECCEDVLNEMKNIYKEMNDQKNDVDNKIYQDRKKFELDERRISYEHEEKMMEMNHAFEIEAKIIDNKKSEEGHEIEPLKQLKKTLEERRQKISGTSADEYVNNFIDGEKTKIESDYQNQINKINEENQFMEEKLEYTEKEKELENNYLNIINGIKNYSMKIPYFDNWIETYKLKKYLN